MKKHNVNVGIGLLFLLRQQCYLYHQLKILTDRQQQSAATGSPELLLECIIGRHKLTKKLRELDGKLRPIKTNRQKLSRQVRLEHKVQAQEVVNQEIVEEISTVAPPETVQHLLLLQDWKFDELFVETES